MAKLTIFFIVLASICVDFNLAEKCYECGGSDKDSCAPDDSTLKDCKGSCVMVHALFGDNEGFLRGCSSESKDKACNIYQEATKKLYECSACNKDKCNNGEFSS